MLIYYLMKIHLKTYTKYEASIRFYGITQDPETHSYMMVLDNAKDENLLEYLKINFNNINRKQKLYNLRELSFSFKDFLEISDFGFSKLIEANPNNPEKKNIFGILPYIVPEVLSGDEEYTKAADDARVTYRPTFEELDDELRKYYYNYNDYLKEEKNKDSEIQIYTSRLNFSKLPKPKNEENFGKES
ncbi:hypothetical protein Glove_57g91 [Diversispora epigaea]|uniref:Protein kinase domain-containing protein n=1 Tax=Diversispora epigaea TaxID=1348612 RepID=A0A397JD44_9GLOM|nr:hypothetical protein Glove_57g91 [Diversispora epigaea]